MRGATRAITQFFFDTDGFVRFVERVRKAGVTIPISPGIMPVSNYKGLVKMSGPCGIALPEWLERLFDGLDGDADTRRLLACSVAAEMCAKLEEEGFSDFHFYTLNRADMVYALCRVLGVREQGRCGMTELIRFLAGVALAIGAPSWTAPMQPFRIVGDLYEVGSQGISAFVLKTKDGLILIDAGMPSYAPQVLANIRTLGFKPTDVKIIIASHAHFDHAGGLAEIKRATGAQLAIMAQDVKADETGTYPGSENRHELDFAPVKVDRVLHDGDTVSLGGETLTAHLTPGHTAGCTTWTFPVVEGGKTLSVIYQCSMSVAANRLLGPPQYPRHRRGLSQELRRAEDPEGRRLPGAARRTVRLG